MGLFGRKKEAPPKEEIPLLDAELLLLIIKKETSEEPISYEDLEKIARSGSYNLDMGEVRFSYTNEDWNPNVPENGGTRFERDLYILVGCGSVDEFLKEGKRHFKLTGIGRWESRIIEENLEPGVKRQAIPLDSVQYRKL